MDTIAFIRDQLREARGFLDGTLEDVSDADAHAKPPGAGNSVAATYAHLVTGEDGFVNGLLRGGAPLLAAEWQGRTGLSEMTRGSRRSSRPTSIATSTSPRRGSARSRSAGRSAPASSGTSPRTGERSAP